MSHTFHCAETNFTGEIKAAKRNLAISILTTEYRRSALQIESCVISLRILTFHEAEQKEENMPHYTNHFSNLFINLFICLFTHGTYNGACNSIKPITIKYKLHTHMLKCMT
jgi:hypothetical protein